MSVAAVVSHPLLYALALAGGVGLGLPMGAAVVGAGALFGGALGVGVVLLGQVIGLAILWYVPSIVTILPDLIGN